ncbi:hypothetical protein B0H13DRAFT_351723 [Mycena leptocephala]|nr:hypothetical protein B0H13DRAFT_351723 [Mycena leptocephala]
MSSHLFLYFLSFLLPEKLPPCSIIFWWRTPRYVAEMATFRAWTTLWALDEIDRSRAPTVLKRRSWCIGGSVHILGPLRRATSATGRVFAHPRLACPPRLLGPRVGP